MSAKPKGPRTLLIVNALSETVKKKGSVLEQIAQDTQHSLIRLDDFAALPVIVKTAAKDKIGWIIIEGGDGTAQGVLTAFVKARKTFKSFPKFTLLPGGMTNQVAKNIGLKKYSVRGVLDLLSSVTPRIKSTPLLHLDIENADPKYGFLVSSGAVPMATEYCKEQIHRKGLGGSLAVAATILRGVSGNRASRDKLMPPTPVSLRITNAKDEAVFNEDHLGTLVTTLPGLIIGLDPFWGDGDGLLRVTYARADARHLLRHVIGLWVGHGEKTRSSDGYESYNANVVRYEYDGPVVLDGETVILPDGIMEIRATEPVDFVY